MILELRVNAPHAPSPFVTAQLWHTWIELLLTDVKIRDPGHAANSPVFALFRESVLRTNHINDIIDSNPRQSVQGVSIDFLKWSLSSERPGDSSDPLFSDWAVVSLQLGSF